MYILWYVVCGISTVFTFCGGTIWYICVYFMVNCIFVYILWYLITLCKSFVVYSMDYLCTFCGIWCVEYMVLCIIFVYILRYLIVVCEYFVIHCTSYMYYLCTYLWYLIYCMCVLYIYVVHGIFFIQFGVYGVFFFVVHT